MAYFSFSSGRLRACGPWRTRASRPWHEWLLALVLAVWALWILDPVVRLGHRFYLGELFHYEGPGFWFGLPLGSQLGFTATAAVTAVHWSHLRAERFRRSSYARTSVDGVDGDEISRPWSRASS